MIQPQVEQASKIILHLTRDNIAALAAWRPEIFMVMGLQLTMG
jgi:hypothetical protein